LIFNFNFDDEYVVVIQALFLWSYICLVTILLMNVLLSIIVGAFVDMQEKSERSLEGKPVIGFYRSFGMSLRFWLDGLFIYSKRLCSTYCQCSCCQRRHLTCCCCRKTPKRHQLKSHQSEGVDAQETPWERLVDFGVKYRLPTGFETTKVVRRRLLRVFGSETTVELIIRWCRTNTRSERLQKFGFHLRGVDPDSQVFKGHTAYLLESILKRLGASNTARYERTTVTSNRTMGSFVGKANKSHRLVRAGSNATQEDEMVMKDDITQGLIVSGAAESLSSFVPVAETNETKRSGD